MRTKYKQWAVDYLEEHPEMSLKSVDMESAFFSHHPLMFEIGSGKGDFILNFSKMHPEANFLAVERVQTVSGMMCKKLIDAEVKNVLVYSDDVAKLFLDVPDGSVDAIYLNFVDPWPKKKHAKRRLTYISFLNSYYRIIKSGGNIYIKTDNTGLYEFTLKEILKTKFILVQNEADYEFDDRSDAMTEYEAKFRTQSVSIHRIVLKKE